MLRNLFVAAIAAGVSAQSSKLIWQQAEQYAIYTTASLSKQHNAAPTFATATYLNPPVMVEVYNVSDTAGAATWQYTASSNQAAFGVDQARHAATATSGFTVDTFAAEVNTGACSVMGFYSAGASANGNAVWTYNIPSCSANLETGGTYVSLQASDDGSTLAFAGYELMGSNPVNASVWVFDAPTGKLRYKFADTSKPLQGLVQVTASGSYVLFVNEPNLYILDGKTGAVRGGVPLQVPYFIPATVSDDGSIVATSNGGTVYLWQWQGSSYKTVQTLNPTGSEPFYVWDMASSFDDQKQPIVVVGYISADVLQVRVTIFSATSGAVLTDYFTAKNAKLQNNPTLRADQNYVGLASWGDSDDIPTVMVLKAGSNYPVFNYTTPGSMFACDIIADVTSSATQDTVWITAAGKAVPANAFGNGGNAYAWQVTVPK